MVEVTEDVVRADPELIMQLERPGRALSSTVLEIICSGRLQQRAVRYATVTEYGCLSSMSSCGLRCRHRSGCALFAGSARLGAYGLAPL